MTGRRAERAHDGGVLDAARPASMVRRALSWAVDYVIDAGLVSIFYFCANVFYLDPATAGTGNLMLVCAIVTLVLLTVALPLRTGGQTVGEHLLRVQVVNRSGRPRTWAQLAVRECALKIAAGPFVAVFCALDYVILGLVVHRDVDHELILDYFLKTRVYLVR